MGAKNLQCSDNHVALSIPLAENDLNDAKPQSFAEALRIQLKTHHDTCASLSRALPSITGSRIDSSLRDWVAGKTIPRQLQSLALLNSIERHYGLGEGYFAGFIAKQNVSYLRHPCNQSPFQT